MKTEDEDIADSPESKMENFHDVTSTKAKYIMKEYLKDKNTDDDGVEKFNDWMISRANKSNQKPSNISYVCSQFAILEASDNIFLSWSGLKKHDLKHDQGFNLKNILEILRKIGDDVEVILNAPQKETVLHFQTFVSMTENDSIEDAYEILKLVYEMGTRALVFADRRSISVEVFEDTLKVVNILISSTILYCSYDKVKKLFLPSYLLPFNKRKLIGEEIEKLINKCVDLQTKVDIGKTFFKFVESSTKKTKAQNDLNRIISASYPYIRLVIINL